MQYTLDLNRGLTQVLANGTNTYLYGRSAGSGPTLRLGEEGPDGWQHHLGDALGSVRTLADGSAEVTSARAYEPFGATLTSAGPTATNYGFREASRSSRREPGAPANGSIPPAWCTCAPATTTRHKGGSSSRIRGGGMSSGRRH